MMSPDIKRELEDRISANPIAAVAIALAAGAIVALARRTRDAAPKRTIGSVIIGGLSALAMGVVKDALLGQLSGAAKSWLDSEGAMNAPEGARRDPAESFLEH